MHILVIIQALSPFKPFVLTFLIVPPPPIFECTTDFNSRLPLISDQCISATHAWKYDQIQVICSLCMLNTNVCFTRLTLATFNIFQVFSILIRSF